MFRNISSKIQTNNSLRKSVLSLKILRFSVKEKNFDEGKLFELFDLDYTLQDEKKDEERLQSAKSY